MTPTELVETFLASMNRIGGLADAISTYFTDDTVYENVGMTHSTGIAGGLEVVRAFEAGFGPFALKVDNLAVTGDGNRVLTERVDHIVSPAGETLMSIRLMGIFETEDGKITAWRDYFDTAPFKPAA